MVGKIFIITLIVLFLISTLVFLTACNNRKIEPSAPEKSITETQNKKEYKVIYPEGLFENVKSSYKAGQTVRVYFPMVATDTDYTFYLDGERINSSGYSDFKGYTIEFTMPDHDVELTCESKNSMEYVPTPVDLPYGSEIFSYVETTHTPEGNTVFGLNVTTVSNTEHCMTVLKEDGSTEVYTIPRFPYDSLCSYNDITDLSSWNNLEEYDSLKGKSIELNFYYYGEYITLSSESMPEDGEGVLKYLVSNFTDYMTEDYLTE